MNTIKKVSNSASTSNAFQVINKRTHRPDEFARYKLAIYVLLIIITISSGLLIAWFSLVFSKKRNFFLWIFNRYPNDGIKEDYVADSATELPKISNRNITIFIPWVAYLSLAYCIALTNWFITSIILMLFNVIFFCFLNVLSIIFIQDLCCESLTSDFIWDYSHCFANNCYTSRMKIQIEIWNINFISDKINQILKYTIQSINQ